MRTLVHILEEALAELYQRGVIDWILEDNAPETFVSACAFQYDAQSTTYFVWMEQEFMQV